MTALLSMSASTSPAELDPAAVGVGYFADLDSQVAAAKSARWVPLANLPPTCRVNHHVQVT